MEVLTLENELLREKAKPVKKFDGHTADLAREMAAILQNESGIGLAGPQVGVFERFFITLVPNDKIRVFVNPSIIETSIETSKYEEGCLSIPGVFEDVVRPSRVKVQAWDESGKVFNLECGGVLARCVQHEYDHLEGVLFIDKLSEFKRTRLLDKYEKVKKQLSRPMKKRRMGFR
jgi:peptide deformylase